ncbi:unnamed protein product [Rotaria sp. Silwood2]|nr:unnamed protein product [Rotaria sp. Silwood2]CAF4535730.1 unnamed protein product [Rotaria sp. Silwood2]
MDHELNRYYIKIRTVLEIDPKTIHEELVTALGPSAPSYTTFTRWAKRVREGREDVNDDPRSGRPVSELTDENIELVRQVINNDPHSTYDEIIAETSHSLSWYNRANYPRLSQDEKSYISLGTLSTN